MRPERGKHRRPVLDSRCLHLPCGSIRHKCTMCCWYKDTAQEPTSLDTVFVLVIDIAE
jgi:hypothetical protein